MIRSKPGSVEYLDEVNGIADLVLGSPLAGINRQQTQYFEEEGSGDTAVTVLRTIGEDRDLPIYLLFHPIFGLYHIDFAPTCSVSLHAALRSLWGPPQRDMPHEMRLTSGTMWGWRGEKVRALLYHGAYPLEVQMMGSANDECRVQLWTEDFVRVHDEREAAEALEELNSQVREGEKIRRDMMGR